MRALPSVGDWLVDADQAAGVLGMTGGATRKTAARVTIPPERVGRRLRFGYSHG